MFEPTSRYAGLETAELAVTGAVGEPRTVTYVRRRFVPAPDSAAGAVSHAVAQRERLDHLATRAFGDPTQFWRICDANGALRPAELEEPGRRIDLPLAGGL
jgi:hypothetical protein